MVGGDLFGRVTFCVFELLPGFCDGNFEHAPWPELKIEPTPALPSPAAFGGKFHDRGGISLKLNFTDKDWLSGYLSVESNLYFASILCPGTRLGSGLVFFNV